MEIQANDRVLLIDDDPMVRLMAVLAQYDKECAALAIGETGAFNQSALGFASIFDPRL